MQTLLAGCCLVILFSFSAAKPHNGEVGFVCPTPNGYFVDGESCHGYWHCSGGVPSHHDCPSGGTYNPWTKSCGGQSKKLACFVYVHPEDWHIKTVYYITESFDWHEGDALCRDAGLGLISIGNWDEDTFAKNSTLYYEQLYHFDQRLTYWTSGWRTSHSSPKHRDFIWSVTKEYVGYSDWCDAGLISQKRMDAPQYPPPCNPDKLSNMAIHLNTSYIESYGWWDAWNEHDKKAIICEYNAGDVPTPPTPTPTKPTDPTTKPTTTTKPVPTTTPLPEEEFKEMARCLEAGRFGFCEKFVYCVVDGRNIKWNGTYDCPHGQLFDNDVQECVPKHNFHGNYCDLPANECRQEGIFRNKRHCGRFYVCVPQPGGTYLQKDYTCPPGWIYPALIGGPNVTCARETDQLIDPCYFTYTDTPSDDVVHLDDSRQCSEHGQFDRESTSRKDDFLHCLQEPDQNWGQFGTKESYGQPWLCPEGSVHDAARGYCV